MGCHRDAAVVTALQDAEQYMQEHPDSSLHILARIDLSMIRREKTRAKYALLYSQALDKNYIDTDSDSLIRIAVDYSANHGLASDRVCALAF